jgi:hypothetical protein
MEMAPGALPRPGRVPEQGLLSPKICLQRRRSCGTVLGKTPIPLGFSIGRLLIGEGASSGGDQGGPHHRWAWPGPRPRTLMVWAASSPPPAPIWSSSSVREK